MYIYIYSTNLEHQWLQSPLWILQPKHLRLTKRNVVSCLIIMCLISGQTPIGQDALDCQWNPRLLLVKHMFCVGSISIYCCSLFCLWNILGQSLMSGWFKPKKTWQETSVGKMSFSSNAPVFTEVPCFCRRLGISQSLCSHCTRTCSLRCSLPQALPVWNPQKWRSCFSLYPFNVRKNTGEKIREHINTCWDYTS